MKVILAIGLPVQILYLCTKILNVSSENKNLTNLLSLLFLRIFLYSHSLIYHKFKKLLSSENCF